MNDSFQMRRSDSVLLGVLSAGAYLIIALFSTQLGSGTTQSIPVWLSSGVVFGLLISIPKPHWDPLLMGVSLASAVWAWWAHGLTGISMVSFAALDTGSVLIGAWFASLGRNRDPVLAAAFLIAGTFLTSVLGATLSAALWYLSGLDEAYGKEWLAWALSTGCGIALVAPIVMHFRDFRLKLADGLSMQSFFTGLTTFVMFVGATMSVFSKDAVQRFGAISSTLGYVPMPFLLVTSLIWGALGGALSTLVGALLVFRLTVDGWGPFAVADSVLGDAIVGVQSYVLVWAVVIHLAQALLASRQIAYQRVRRWQLHCERILQASHVASVEFDVATGSAEWGETAANVLGAEVTRLHHISDWLDCLRVEERSTADTKWSTVANGECSVSDATHKLRIGSQDLVVHVRFAGVKGPDGGVERVAGVIWIVSRVFGDAGDA
ncbi:MASE1 domain-containing protein [Pandoraea sp. SD6-2]|uniref:MASE1 domain-containing protein n=1 Tax=Pandoraea sp. SD6-2 TaxID=1286093 RepID=UPI00033117D9|nr:MASE1 domain-containing protein [Pandoraea sp. SD6-2]EON14945.1 transmembrane protein [Pandoraea sp. SD6-2]